LIRAIADATVTALDSRRIQRSDVLCLGLSEKIEWTEGVRNGVRRTRSFTQITHLRG